MRSCGKVFFIVLPLVFILGLGIGFGLGVYFLPIIVADAPAEEAVLQAEEREAEFQAVFTKDLPGSDFAHWGEGTLLLSEERVTLMGEVSPGPDYRLYLAPQYADDEESFLRIKNRSLQVASIKGFKDFSYPIPSGIDIDDYRAVVIWCERFSEFITAGRLTERQ